MVTIKKVIGLGRSYYFSLECEFGLTSQLEPLGGLDEFNYPHPYKFDIMKYLPSS